MARARRRQRQTVQWEYSEEFRYTLTFDDPALGTWTGHGAETAHFTDNAGGTIFHDTFNSKEGPVQIIVHVQLHTDAAGDTTVNRTFNRYVGC